MAPPTDVLIQDYIPSLPRPVPVRHCGSNEAGDHVAYILGTQPDVVGVAISLSPTGYIQTMSFASPQRVLCVALDHRKKAPSASTKLFEHFISGELVPFAGFGFAYQALALAWDLKCPVQGVDLSTFLSKSTREQRSPGDLVREEVYPKIDRFKVDSLWDIREDEEYDSLCIRAWISASISARLVDKILASTKVDTTYLSPEQLVCLAKVAAEVHRLRSLRPTSIENDFLHVKETKDGTLDVQNARYKSRIRNSRKTQIEIQYQNGQSFRGRSIRSEGRQTQIRTARGMPHGGSAQIQSITIHGRQDLTSAEKAFDEFLLLVLQGQQYLDESDFIAGVWFPSPSSANARKVHVAPMNLGQISDLSLNASQQEVIRAMIDEMKPIVVTHGPPGTGKTTTISVAVSHWARNRLPVWIIAQSNVAVKNIAESLAKRDVDFTLIVSKEFYVEWHEHIYEKIQERIIRSDEMPEEPLDVQRRLGGCCVILCTLSMLSNPVVEDRGIFELVRPERLVIDEASQINISDFMPIFHRFKRLIKVCFFGDPNQLPPYGQDKVHLRSVFEIKHLRDSAFFLNIQYRMPEPIGHFLSRQMYESKLYSEHQVKDMSCIRFIHVSKGCEEQAGKSWRNMEEVHTIVNLVRDYYRREKFVIVTPYDAQRAELERQLKAAQLPWERVFNVDSFQGNEEAFVIISVARTARPGFLISDNRTNVMLSRCKRGMVIVTNQVFLRTSGRDTLIGRLASHWEAHRGEHETWADWKHVAEGRAHMPGIPPRTPRALPVGTSIPAQTSTGTSQYAHDGTWNPFPNFYSSNWESSFADHPQWMSHGFGPSPRAEIVIDDQSFPPLPPPGAPISVTPLPSTRAKKAGEKDSRPSGRLQTPSSGSSGRHSIQSSGWGQPRPQLQLPPQPHVQSPPQARPQVVPAPVKEAVWRMVDSSSIPTPPIPAPTPLVTPRARPASGQPIRVLRIVNGTSYVPPPAKIKADENQLSKGGRGGGKGARMKSGILSTRRW